MFMNRPEHKDEHPGVLGEVHHGHERRADLHHGVAMRLLRGVTGLVARDGDTRHRAARRVLARKVQTVVARVVMVSQVAVHALDVHRMAAVGVEHATRHVGSGRAGGGHAAPRAVRRVDIALRRQADDRRHQDEQHICGVESKSITVVRHARFFLKFPTNPWEPCTQRSAPTCIGTLRAHCPDRVAATRSARNARTRGTHSTRTRRAHRLRGQDASHPHAPCAQRPHVRGASPSLTRAHSARTRGGASPSYAPCAQHPHAHNARVPFARTP